MVGTWSLPREGGLWIKCHHVVFQTASPQIETAACWCIARAAQSAARVPISKTEKDTASQQGNTVWSGHDFQLLYSMAIPPASLTLESRSWWAFAHFCQCSPMPPVYRATSGQEKGGLQVHHCHQKLPWKNKRPDHFYMPWFTPGNFRHTIIRTLSNTFNFITQHVANHQDQLFVIGGDDILVLDTPKTLMKECDTSSETSIKVSNGSPTLKASGLTCHGNRNRWALGGINPLLELREANTASLDLQCNGFIFSSSKATISNLELSLSISRASRSVQSLYRYQVCPWGLFGILQGTI